VLIYVRKVNASTTNLFPLVQTETLKDAVRNKLQLVLGLYFPRLQAALAL